MHLLKFSNELIFPRLILNFVTGGNNLTPSWSENLEERRVFAALSGGEQGLTCLFWRSEGFLSRLLSQRQTCKAEQQN
jgi:hypothetical protein